MEVYLVTGYKGTRDGWSTSDIVVGPSEVMASDSYDAARKVISEFFGKPTKIYGVERPPDVIGVFFKTKRPKIVIHVEDLNVIRSYKSALPLYE